MFVLRVQVLVCFLVKEEIAVAGKKGKAMLEEDSLTGAGFLERRPIHEINSELPERSHMFILKKGIPADVISDQDPLTRSRRSVWFCRSAK